jgi:hypothetical protein
MLVPGHLTLFSVIQRFQTETLGIDEYFSHALSWQQITVNWKLLSKPTHLYNLAKTKLMCFILTIVLSSLELAADHGELQAAVEADTPVQPCEDQAHVFHPHYRALMF